MIDVALVGTGGMMPLPGRFLSSMLCRVHGNMILFDCGEGTQVSLRMLGWGFKNIDMICFTHFHGDHISGLPGLLLTMANADRTEPVKLFGPTGLEHVVKSLCVIAQDLPFPLEFYELDAKSEHEYRDGMLVLKTLPLNHRSHCFAYSLELMRRGKFDLERAQKLNIPVQAWGQLQKLSEETLVYNNETYTPEMVLGPPRKGLKIVFCTDTRPVKALPDFAQNADLLVCEGLYGAEDKDQKAAAHKHMSFKEAATIAKKAEVQELWLTHFSPAMPNPKEHLNIATKIFDNTKIGKDRMSTVLKFQDE